MRHVRTAVSVVAATVAVIAFALFPTPSFGNLDSEEADHMLLPESDGVGYCGRKTGREPWLLHVAASSPGAAFFTIEFRDGDAITFEVPPGSSIAMTQAFGGVPGVDDLVRLELTGDASAVSLVSANARSRKVGTDPFSELGTAETDNLCVNLADEGPIGTALEVPDSWVADGDGSNGGTLQ